MTSDHKVAMFTRSLSVQSGAAPAAVDGAGPVAAVLGLPPEQIWAEAVKYRAANVPSVFTISEKASTRVLMCFECERASWHFQPGKGPSMGLLCDCENIAD